MRTRWGWALSVLGLLVALAGAALMAVLGPDSRFTTGPHPVETDAIAVVTAPKVVRWADVKLDVLAEVPVRKPVFIGIANSVDVQDYLARTGRLEITSFSRPWTIRTRTIEGAPNLPGAPTALDWWIDSDAGLGGASISTELPDQTVSIAVLSVGSSNLAGLQLTVAYGVAGGFAKGASALLLGVALVWIGVLVRRGPWADGDEDDWDDAARDDEPAASADDEEEVVYVYVDDDGVEHEISAEEAAGLQVVEEVVEVEPPTTPTTGTGVEAAAVEPAVPTVPQVTVPGILTAADIAAGAEDPVAPPTGPRPDDEQDAEPDDQQDAEQDDEQVVYVYVDEDGVEHEVSEAELAEFEVVDDDDPDADSTDDGKGRS